MSSAGHKTVDFPAHLLRLVRMLMNDSAEQRTYLAAWKARYGTSVTRLALELKISRNHVYHLLDPTNDTYAGHAVGPELIARLARYLGKRRSDVEANYLAVAGRERKAS